MSEAKTRKVHTPEFKAKVGLEALRGVKTINAIRQKYGFHPVQVGQWKKGIQEQTKTLSEGKRGPKPMAAHREPELLYSEIALWSQVKYEISVSAWQASTRASRARLASPSLPLSSILEFLSRHRVRLMGCSSAEKKELF
jgi:transposase-like protein